MYPNIQLNSTIKVDVFQYTTNCILCNNTKLILHTK